MKHRALFWIGVFLFLAVSVWFAAAVRAAPAGQQGSASPTPGPDGRILYTVQENDNCGSISLRFGVSVDYIRTTNHLDINCTLQVGQKIMIGMGGPAVVSPTPGPSPTPTSIPPTATPKAGGLAQVCVLVYDDENGDGLRQATEPPVAGAAVSLTSLSGTYSQTLNTSIPSDPNAYQGSCFNDVPAGKYTVSAAVPEGYNATTELTFTLETVNAGDISYVDFGAQVKTAPTNPSTGGRSPLLGIVGAIFVLLAVGLGVYAWRIMRR